MGPAARARAKVALLAAAASAAALASQVAKADTPETIWQGTGSDWNTAADWSNGFPTASLSAEFNSAFTTQPTFSAAAAVQGIWLTGALGQPVTINPAAAQNLTIAGTATLNGNPNVGIVIDDPGNFGLTLGANVNTTLSNSTSFLVNNASTLNVSGGVSLGSNTLTLGGNNTTGSTAISGVISGAGGLTVNTLGSVTLTGSSTYTGNTTVNGGTLIYSGGGSGYTGGTVAGNLIVNSGGTLQFNRTDTFGNASTTSPVVLTLNAGGTVSNTTGGFYDSFNNPTLNGGTIILNSGIATFGSYGLRGTVTVGGAAPSTIKIGTAGTNDFISLGQQNTTNSTTFTVGAYPASLTISAPLANNGGATSGLVLNGPGTLILTAANSFSGNITLNSGTLQASTTNLNTSNPTSGPLGNATVARTITVAAFSTLNMNIGNILGTGTLAQSNVSLIDSGTITNTSGDTNTLGPLTLTNGTLTANSGTGNASFQTYVFSQPVTVSGTGQSLMSTAGTTNAGFHLGAASAAANISFTVASGASLLVSAPLIGGSSASGGQGGALTKAGPGTMTLAATNTYSNGTTVSAGTLVAATSTALAANGALTVSSGGTFNYAPVTSTPLALGTGVLNLAAGSAIGAPVGVSTAGITSTAAAVTTGAVTVNLFGTGSTVTTGATTLVTAGSGLLGGGSTTYTLGSIYNASNFTVTPGTTITATDTALSVNVVSATPLTTEYWQGTFSGGNNVWAISDGNANSNWATAQTGGATSLVPGPSTTVVFSANTPANEGSMVLGSNMSIAGLVVNDTNPVVLYADSNTLTIGSGGITINTGANFNIGAAIKLGAAQTWTNNSTLPLNIFGSVSGALNLSTAGTGPISLTGTNFFPSFSLNAGTLNITAGTTTETTGTNPQTVNGTLNIGGTGSFLSGGGQLWVGQGGTSTLNLSTGGTLVVNNWLAIGRNGGNGTLNMSGGFLSMNTGNHLDIGAGGGATDTGTSLLNQSGGTITDTASALWIGELGAATYTISGGIANLGAIVMSQGNFTSTLNLNGGTVSTSGISTNTPAASSTLHFNGGTLTPSAASTTFMTGLTAADVDTGGAFINNNGFSITIAQSLLHGTGTPDSGLTQSGSGTMTLTGSNTYTGGTTINAGSLLANSTGTSSTGTGSIKVNAGATLGGSGNIGLGTGSSVVIASGAVMAPGLPASTGSTLTITGGLGASFGTASGNGGTFAVKTAGSGVNDSLVLAGTGTLALGTGATLAITDTAASLGNNYVIASWATGPETGNFANVMLNGTAQSLIGSPTTVGTTTTYPYSNLSVIYADPATGAGFIQVDINPVPEPASLGLLALGGLGLLARRRRRAGERRRSFPCRQG